MVQLLRRMSVAAGMIAFYVVASVSYRENPAGAACFVASVVILLFGGFVLSRKPSRAVNRAFFYFSLALGSHVLAVYLLHMAISWGIDRIRPAVWLLRNGSMLAPTTLMYLTYRFEGKRRRFLLVLACAAFVSMLPLVVLNFAGRYLVQFRRAQYAYVPAEPLTAYKFFAGLVMFWLLVWWVIAFTRCLRPSTSRNPVHGVVLFVGFTMGIIPSLLGLVPALGKPWYPSFAGVSLAFIPIILGFGVIRFSLFDIKVVVRRTLPYAVGTTMIGAVYALVLAALEAIVGDLGGLPAGAKWIVLLVLMGFGFQPTLEMFQKWLDRVFFRVEAELDRFLAHASERYGRATSPYALARLVAADAQGSLKLTQAGVLLGGKDISVAVTGSKDATFDHIIGLRVPHHTSDGVIDLSQEDGSSVPEGEDSGLWPILKKTGVQLAVPFGEAGARGFLVCGRKLSGLDLTPRDTMFLEALASQAGMALARLKAEKEADEAQQMTEAILQLMPNAVALVDAGGMILSSNPAFERTFGAGSGRSLDGSGLSEALASGSSPMIREIETPKGVFLANSDILKVPAGAENRLVVLTDISDLRRLQEADRRRSALAQIGTMISSINHEVMNILSPVAFYLDIAQRHCKTREGGDALDTVRQRVKALDVLCRGLRDYYREPVLSPCPVQLRHVVDSALSDLAATMGDGWLAPRTAHLDIPLRADPQKLKQVLVNILKNAWEAMSEVRKKRWSVCAVVREGNARVEIEDCGVGMRPDVVKRVLEPFFTSKKEGGTGLGLAIARRIAEAHGGEVQVQSSLGQGTKVTLVWPVAA